MKFPALGRLRPFKIKTVNHALNNSTLVPDSGRSQGHRKRRALAPSVLPPTITSPRTKTTRLTTSLNGELSSRSPEPKGRNLEPPPSLQQYGLIVRKRKPTKAEIEWKLYLEETSKLKRSIDEPEYNFPRLKGVQGHVLTKARQNLDVKTSRALEKNLKRITKFVTDRPFARSLRYNIDGPSS